jgi:WhiB family transcriptional regulator, redox-sensing transcriptional regulator
MGAHVEQKHSGLNTGGTDAPSFDGSQVCAQVDPELFFPENKVDAREKIRLVRPICGSCDFKHPCLEYALKHDELLGIWGGTTEWDRVRMRKTKRIA